MVWPARLLSVGSTPPTSLYGPGDIYHPQNSHVPAALIRRFHEGKVSNSPFVTVWGTGNPRRAPWAGDEQSFIRLKATADEEGAPFTPEFLAQERHALGEDAFKREYLGIPSGGHVSPFTWDLYERATKSHQPVVAPGPAFWPSTDKQPVKVENPFRRLRVNGVVP